MGFLSKIFGLDFEEAKKTTFDEKLGRLTILGKSKNWNPETRCKICEKLVGRDIDAWNIEWVALSDITRKDTKLFSVCGECYEKKYGIYPEKEREASTPREYAEYTKLSVAKRNRQFFQIFPKEFWEKIRVSEKGALSLINFILDGESDIYSMSSEKVAKVLNADSVKIIDQIDEYTKKLANSFSDEFKIPKISLTGEAVLFYDRTIPDKQSRILYFEVLVCGMGIVNALSSTEKDKLREHFRISDFTDEVFLRALYTCAATSATTFLETMDVFKRTITPTFPNMVVEKTGLLKYLHWLRKFGISYELTGSAEEFLYTNLLSMSKSK